MPKKIIDKNTKLLLSIFGIVILMIGVSFASVPLYDLFCKTTGFGGTTQVSDAAPAEDEILEREVTIRFNGDTNRNLNWAFKPERNKVTLNVGQQGLITFKAKNNDSLPVAGTAVYNVTPAKAGQYFHKTQCFCFDAQTLTPNQEMDMPVLFYIDPKMAEDRNMDDVKTITLSYSFFKSDSKELDSALEAFYNAE